MHFLLPDTSLIDLTAVESKIHHQVHSIVMLGMVGMLCYLHIVHLHHHYHLLHMFLLRDIHFHQGLKGLHNMHILALRYNQHQSNILQIPPHLVLPIQYHLH